MLPARVGPLQPMMPRAAAAAAATSHRPGIGLRHPPRAQRPELGGQVSLAQGRPADGLRGPGAAVRARPLVLRRVEAEELVDRRQGRCDQSDGVLDRRP